MNVVDSSGWLEYFADAQNAQFFAPPIHDLTSLMVPSICIAEVFKWILREMGEENAIEAAAHMSEGLVVDLDGSIAVFAAKIGHEFKLPLADGIVLATTKLFDATLWTQDTHFDRFEKVKVVRKK